MPVLHSSLVALALATAATLSKGQVLCNDGYTCWQNETSGVVWVKKDDGNTNGPTCKSVCQNALDQNEEFFVCDEGRSALKSKEELAPIAEGMGFNCDASGGCWDMEAPGFGLVLVTKGDDPTKRCYFPSEDTLRCDTDPGNGNCFGERYSSICPCVQTELDGACEFESPPHFPANPTFREHGNENGTDCLSRINYWRKVACEEGWRECPNNGLPPVTECTCCHECANSESVYDREYGAHKSFQRCGEMVQGQGGGANCAAVIDSFISERYAKTDENGQYICDGHCGPIVKPGCWAFHWGKDPNSGFHTLNWRSCNWQKCTDYCSNPSSNACVSSDPSIEPNLCGCDDIEAEEHPECTQAPTPAPPESGGDSGSDGSDGSDAGNDGSEGENGEQNGEEDEGEEGDEEQSDGGDNETKDQTEGDKVDSEGELFVVILAVTLGVAMLGCAAGGAVYYFYCRNKEGSMQYGRVGQ